MKTSQQQDPSAHADMFNMTHRRLQDQHKAMREHPLITAAGEGQSKAVCLVHLQVLLEVFTVSCWQFDELCIE